MQAHRIVKVVGNVEEDHGQIVGDRAQVIAKLKSATGWTEEMPDGRIIIAGNFYYLRPGNILMTRDDIQQMFGVAEPIHVG